MKRFLSAGIAALVMSLLIVITCIPAFADSGFTIQFAGTYEYGGIETISNLIDCGNNTYAYTMHDKQSFTLARSYTFSAGYWYSGRFLFEVRTGLANTVTNVVCTLSVGNYASILRGSCTTRSDGYGVVSIPFDFCPDVDFTTNLITLTVSMSGTPNYGLGTVRDTLVSVMTDGEHQSKLYNDAVKNQTDRILSGDGLHAPGGGQFGGAQGSAGSLDSANKALDKAFGGSGGQFGGAKNKINDTIKSPDLGTNIPAAFSAINTLFSRVVSSLDLSVVLTFLLVFGLAMYVVGRRVR